MENAMDMNMDAMLELLATETSSYSRMLHLGLDKTEEFKSCQDLIISLQHEIVRRNSLSEDDLIYHKYVALSK